MSYLWVDAAAHQAGWWNDDRDQEFEQGPYPVRDPAEKIRTRRNRYVSQIVDRHNVSRKAAFEAMMAVAEHLEKDSAFAHTTDYGFASAPGSSGREHYSDKMMKRLQDPEVWRGRRVEQIPTDEIHATQSWVRPSSVAHNLFWPGHRQSWNDDEHGDPDIEPDPGDDDEGEGEFESAEERELHRHAKFVERSDGRIECADGHHRVAADLLLGKKTTPGHLVTERELMRPPGQKLHDWPMNADAMRAHMTGQHGWHPGDIENDSFREMDRVHDYEHLTWQHKMNHDHE